MMKKNIPILCMLVLLQFNSVHSKPRLVDFAENAYSQFGEDGIIKKIFETIGARSKVAIEFGAWDGFHLSNTANLWANNEWKGILIEGDEKRFHDLQVSVHKYNCVAINAWVGIHKKDSLEAILQKNNIDIKNIDLLSIDVDGNDYHIFESLKSIRPRVIICEYNPTIPVHYDVYAPYYSENNFGCSVGALMRIAEKKGYKLVALTTVNAFFVLKEDFAKFKAFETDLRLININDGYITLVTTYDGEYALLKNQKSVYFYGVDKPINFDVRGDCVRCDKQALALINMPAAYRKSGS